MDFEGLMRALAQAVGIGLEGDLKSHTCDLHYEGGVTVKLFSEGDMLSLVTPVGFVEGETHLLRLLRLQLSRSLVGDHAFGLESEGRTLYLFRRYSLADLEVPVLEAALGRLLAARELVVTTPLDEASDPLVVPVMAESLMASLV